MFFLSAFFFFCRHVFLLCLFLGVSLLFFLFRFIIGWKSLCLPGLSFSFMPFSRLFGFLRFFICDFSLFKFICMDFSAWLRFLDSDFFHMAYYLLFFLFVASLPELRFFPGARLLCFRDFSEGHSLFSFSGTALLFSDSTLKCLSPFNAHLRLNRIRFRRVSGLFFPSIFTKGAVLIYFILPAKETGKCPYRRSDRHALSDSLKSRMPIIRRTRTLYRLVVYLHSKYVFGFFETYVSSAGSPAKMGIFLAFKYFCSKGSFSKHVIKLYRKKRAFGWGNKIKLTLHTPHATAHISSNGFVPIFA